MRLATRGPAAGFEEQWLRYAREIVRDTKHLAACQALGGSPSPPFASDVRLPGYLGSGYPARGVLLIANIHTEFDTSPGLTSVEAHAAEQMIRDWRDGRIDDGAFLAALRTALLR
jgi:hypothetical protein